SAGDHRIPDLNGADAPALRLDHGAACAGDGAGDSAAKLEVIVGGVDDGVDILPGEIALDDGHAKTVGPPAHPAGCACQAIEAIRASTSVRLIGCKPWTLNCWIVKDAITIAYANASRTVSSFSVCCSARQPRNPAATASPAPVGSIGGSTGRAGR